jgi:uncharacterized protein YbjT (DUF2867 family)
MRVTVIGASGGIGRQVVRQGLAAGHEVTAVVRDSAGSAAAIREWESLGPVRVAVVSALEAEELTDVVAGRDAVVSAPGPHGRAADPTINSRGVRAAVEAMRATGVRRIVAVSAAPVGPPESAFVRRVLVRPVLWRVFRVHYEDLERMEQVLRDSGLDWTVVRPPKLTDRPARGAVRTAVDAPVAGARFLSRADVAGEMLRALTDPATAGHALALA